MANTLGSWGRDGRASQHTVLRSLLRIDKTSPGELREIVHYLARDYGWEPYLSVLIPLSAEPQPDFAEKHVMEQILSSDKELVYSELISRWLVLDVLDVIATTMLAPGLGGDWVGDNIETRERIAGIMPLLCSIWPYAEAVWRTPVEQPIDWKGVGTEIRFQGRW
jgi:hypothetical protein